MSQSRWYRSRATWLNVALTLIAAGGAVAMILSLVVAFYDPQIQRRMLTAATPTPISTGRYRYLLGPDLRDARLHLLQSERS